MFMFLTIATTDPYKSARTFHRGKQFQQLKVDFLVNISLSPTFFLVYACFLVECQYILLPCVLQSQKRIVYRMFVEKSELFCGLCSHTQTFGKIQYRVTGMQVQDLVDSLQLFTQRKNHIFMNSKITRKSHLTSQLRIQL